MNTPDLDPPCRRVDPELWFPSGDGWTATYQGKKAKQICRSCPLQARCLQYALDNREEYGIWGGTTPKDRAKLLRAAS